MALALRYALRALPSSRTFAHRSRGLATIHPQTSLFAPIDTFSERHIGPDDDETSFMLSKLGYKSMNAFIEATVPPKIRIQADTLDSTSIPALSETELHARAKELGAQNKPFRSYIGMGYHTAVVPPVILRNVHLIPLLLRFPVIEKISRYWKILHGILLTPPISLRLHKVCRHLITFYSSSNPMTLNYRAVRVPRELPDHGNVSYVNGHCQCVTSR